MVDDPARRRLGRGLAALIGDMGEPAPAAEARPAPPTAPRRLPVAFLRANPKNPRKAFDGGELDDLAASIREKGVVQPILVRPVAGAGDSYEIIAGERRWRAAQKAGLHDVPVVVQDVSDKEALEMAIIENVQRADLNPLEEALGYQQLVDGHGYTQAQLAEVIGKSRPHIANTLRLLKLPEGVREYLRTGQLSAGHARALVTHPDPESAAKRIVEAGIPDGEVEAIAGDGAARPPSSRKPRWAAASQSASVSLGNCPAATRRSSAGWAGSRASTTS
ncbi:MAG TPA: ParB/RepB/Spo0J family partition protein, partial [Bauldia sp.]|nr:ParB/RepB/Spo0J family partition protein [Bauldia sp.]